jgi:hypothetical protein
MNLIICQDPRILANDRAAYIINDPSDRITTERFATV